MFKKLFGTRLIAATAIALAVVGGFVAAVLFGIGLYADWKGTPF